MNDPDSPLDLGALDPSRDAARWNAMVARVVARAVAGSRLTVARQLALWARPAMAIAATLVLVAWGGTALLPEAAPTAPRSAAETVTAWAVGDTSPSTSQVLSLLEAQHGR